MTDEAMPYDPLALEFARSKPDEVAALLANSDVHEVDSLLQSFPASTAASLAVRLPSWQLNHLLEVMSPEQLSSLLHAAQVDEAVALVSHLNESRYTSILDACQKSQRRVLRDLFEFPTHSVASLATTRFIRAQSELRCAVFGEQLALTSDTRPRPIMAVDKLGKYRGIVNLQAVYARKNRDRLIADIATTTQALNGVTDAQTALSSTQWSKYSELPVVNNSRQLLGVVSRAALLRVVGDSQPMEFGLESILSELSSAYLNISGNLLEVILGKPK